MNLSYSVCWGSRMARVTAPYILCMAAFLASPSTAWAAGSQDQAKQQEYKLKAVVIYNIIKFVEGFHFEDPNRGQTRLIIGIAGKDQFKDSFNPLLDKPVLDNRYIAIRTLPLRAGPKNDPSAIDQNDINALRQCHVLFISGSERQRFGSIISAVQGLPVLTIADVPGFLEQGGVINLGIENNKIYFEINLAAASRANLTLRSQLLRLAKRLIREDNISDRRS